VSRQVGGVLGWRWPKGRVRKNVLHGHISNEYERVEGTSIESGSRADRQKAYDERSVLTSAYQRGPQPRNRHQRGNETLAGFETARFVAVTFRKRKRQIGVDGTVKSKRKGKTGHRTKGCSGCGRYLGHSGQEVLSWEGGRDGERDNLLILKNSRTKGRGTIGGSRDRIKRQLRRGK